MHGMFDGQRSVQGYAINNNITLYYAKPVEGLY